MKKKPEVKNELVGKNVIVVSGGPTGKKREIGRVIKVTKTGQTLADVKEGIINEEKVLAKKAADKRQEEKNAAAALAKKVQAFWDYKGRDLWESKKPVDNAMFSGMYTV